MERTEVAEFYRGKGYLVHESIVVTGQSGNQQRVPLLCEGPLGNLAVFFGDAAGIDGPEIGAAKRVARDLGATAVVAAGSFTGEQRRTAAELGVVLLDAASTGAVLPAPVQGAWPGQTRREGLERDLEAHPWPASGRPEGLDADRRASALADIDEVVARAGTTPALARPPPSPAQDDDVPQASAAPVPPTAVPARSTDGGLWKHGRTQPTGSTQSMQEPAREAPTRSGRFAWLDLPPQASPPTEAEYVGSVAARAQGLPAPELTAAEREELRVERLAREVRMRRLVKRGAWVLGVAVFVYLFLLWWL